MSDRTVTSPAGQEVVILDDAAFAELAGLEDKAYGGALSLSPLPARIAVLAALWFTGPIKDPKSGRATGKLQDLSEALLPGIPPIRNLMLAPSLGACVDRKTKGKRTYSISLQALPERWLRHIEAYAMTEEKTAHMERGTGAEVAHGVAPIGAPGPRPPIPVLDLTEPSDVRQEVPPPALATEVADAVATALLAQVVAILSEGARGPAAASETSKLRSELEALAGRLADQGTYVERLRRELRLANDRVGALAQERDGLRQRLRGAEHNLKVATSSDAQAVIDTEVQRQVARFMEGKPSAKAAGDIEEDLGVLVNGRTVAR